jgi:GT2 family glycosyltransferase
MKNRNYPKISVVVLNCNGLRYLKKTIPAIFKLDYPDYEVVVVDNYSSDNSLEYLSKFKKIRVKKNKSNLGYSMGKNIGINYATGKYILLLDEDILLKNKKILLELLKNYEETTGIIQPLLVDLGKKETDHYGLHFSSYGVSSHQKPVNIRSILDNPGDLVEIPSPTGGCMFFNKNKWKKIGGFDESQAFNLDDVDIGPRANILGFKNYLYTKDYFIHLGIMNAATNKNYAKRFKLIFSGHGRSMIKNYRFKNLIFRFPMFFLFQLSKAVKYSFKRKTPSIFLSFLSSIHLFFKNLPSTLKERRRIQSKRTVKEDVFLKIKPKKFD